MALTPESVITSDKMKMPVIGLGTWQSTEEEIELAINTALELGYRHIDTAFAYMNEAAIGRVLEKWLSSNRICRDELFIVTKLPSNGMKPDKVEYFLKKSLEALKLDYVDLYLVHSPIGVKYIADNQVFPVNEQGEMLFDMKTDIIAIWKEMEKQVIAGRAKSIGLSNFNIQQITRILQNARITPTNLQIEHHVYLQQPKLIEFCTKKKITVCAYAPLGSPGLQSFVEKTGFGEAREFHVPLTDPVVVQIAKNHGKTPGNVLLRFIIQKGLAVIPKSTNPTRIKENFDIFDFELDDDEMASLKALDKGNEGRMFGATWKGSDKHPEFPFHN